MIADNPALSARIAEAIGARLSQARLEAANETDLEAETTFPDTCPYSWNDITARDFSP